MIDDPYDQSSGPSHGPLDANMVTELVGSYQQVMRGYSKAWLSAWGLVSKPEPSTWLERSTQIWQDWAQDMLEASGGWLPGARWFDRDQLSTLSFVINPAAETAGPKEIGLPVVTDGEVTVRSSDLVRLDRSTDAAHAHMIPALHVEAKIERRRRTLSISLLDLKKLALQPGNQFLGCVYVSAVPKVPLALVHVLVASPRSL